MGHSAALVAGVLRRAIKVQVPRPVCVVVPPAALELWGGDMGQGLYLATGTWPSSFSPLVLPAWASPMGKPRFAGVPDHADGSVILNVGAPQCTGTSPERVDWKVLQPRPKEQTAAKPTDTVAVFLVLVIPFCIL